jgi:hypothetical protein
VVHEVDMRVYSELLPWRKNEVKEIINSLDTGDCMYVNGDNIMPIYVRERSTFHAGFTPSLETVKSPELRSVSASIIQTIERAREGKGPKSPTEQLERRIEQLERMIDSKDERIAELEDVARTLGYIRLEIPSLSGEAATPQTLAEKEDRLAHSLPVVVSHGDTVNITGSVHRDAEDSGDQDAIPESDDHETSCESASDLPPAVHQHVERLVSRFAREETLHRKLLAFLVQHSPGAYSTHQIAAWTNCPQELIEDRPPYGLLNSGLIWRERRTSGTLYRSSLRSFVNREFKVFQPDIGERGLHWVTRTLQNRLASMA